MFPFVFPKATHTWTHLSKQPRGFRQSHTRDSWLLSVSEIPSRERRLRVSGMFELNPTFIPSLWSADTVSVQNRPIKTLIIFRNTWEECFTGGSKESQKTQRAQWNGLKEVLYRWRTLQRCTTTPSYWWRFCKIIKTQPILRLNWTLDILCVCLCFDSYWFTDWCWFLQGRGVKRNYTRGFKLLEKAAAMVQVYS